MSKFVDKLRNAPPLYPYLCKQVFDRVAATGIKSWGSWSNLPNPSRVANVANPHLVVDDESLHTTQASPVSDQGGHHLFQLKHHLARLKNVPLVLKLENGKRTNHW